MVRSVPPGGRAAAGAEEIGRRGGASFIPAAVGPPRSRPGAAAFSGREARASNPNYLPSLYPNENVAEFKAIQTHENAHVTFLVNAPAAVPRVPSRASST